MTTSQCISIPRSGIWAGILFFERGLTLATTTNYGLHTFSDAEANITFKEFRDLLAGTGTDSNMVKIDSWLKQLASELQQVSGDAQVLANDAIAAFRRDLINADNDYLNIGGIGKPIKFKDGAFESVLSNGTFSVNGIEVDNIRFGAFLLKKSDDHVQLSYKPKAGGVE